MFSPLVLLGTLLSPSPQVAVLEALPGGKAPWVQGKQSLAELGTRPIRVTVAALAKGSTGEADEITFKRANGAVIELVVLLPPSAPLPLVIGEPVTIVVGASPGRWGAPERAVGTLIVRDAKGALLLALGDGKLRLPEVAIAPGDVVTREDKGSHVSEDRALVLTHARSRARAITSPRTWHAWTAGRERFAVWANVRTSEIPPAGPPLPPDFVRAWTQLAIVRLGPVVEPRKIDGYASFEWQRWPDAPVDAFDADVGAIRATKGGHTLTFVPIAPGKSRTPIAGTIRLPKGIRLPFRAGARVRVALGHEGGGPNTRGTVVVLDPGGELLLAIGQGGTGIRGLEVSMGDEVRVVPGSGRTQHDHAVVIANAPDLPITLPLDGGVTWTTRGRRYAAFGAAARIDYPPGEPLLPDSVGGWLDVAIVRLP